MSDILVYAQVSDGIVHDVSLQCLAKARELASATGADVACLVPGSSVGDAARSLFGYGAQTVYVADHANLSQYVTTPFKKVVTECVASKGFQTVLFPATTVGDDLAPVVAADIGAACVLDCDDLTVQDGQVVPRRLEFDRKVMTSYAPAASQPLLATLKDGIAETGTADPSRQGEIVPLAVSLTEADRVAKVLKRDVATKSVNLKDAKIIVGAGAGVGSEENFAKIRELAATLGAEIGATRAVVDAGWLPADHQIGQTGATVRPDVYIACGISGAVQHWVGMSEARTIVAINTDKAAPILKHAHYRIVGDLNDVIPKLIKLLG